MLGAFAPAVVEPAPMPRPVKAEVNWLIADKPALPVLPKSVPALPEKYDPYGFNTYREFLEHVTRVGAYFASHGGENDRIIIGVLYVGVEDESVGTYQPHYRVKSGFGGMADGVYDCWYDKAACGPMMQVRKPKAEPVRNGPTVPYNAWYQPPHQFQRWFRPTTYSA